VVLPALLAPTEAADLRRPQGKRTARPAVVAIAFAKIGQPPAALGRGAGLRATASTCGGEISMVIAEPADMKSVACTPGEQSLAWM